MRDLLREQQSEGWRIIWLLQSHGVPRTQLRHLVGRERQQHREFDPGGRNGLGLDMKPQGEEDLPNSSWVVVRLRLPQGRNHPSPDQATGRDRKA